MQHVAHTFYYLVLTTKCKKSHRNITLILLMYDWKKESQKSPQTQKAKKTKKQQQKNGGEKLASSQPQKKNLDFVAIFHKKNKQYCLPGSNREIVHVFRARQSDQKNVKKKSVTIMTTTVLILYARSPVSINTINSTGFLKNGPTARFQQSAENFDISITKKTSTQKKQRV